MTRTSVARSARVETPPPRKAKRANSAGESRSSEAPAAPGSIKVLCVDDHAVLIEGLQAQFAIDARLTLVGWLPATTRLLEEVARLVPDVVVLDVEVPGPDVFELADRIHRLHPAVRVVFLSAHIRDAFITASFEAGAAAYFAKSDELDDIIQGIHAVVASEPGDFLLGPKVRHRCAPLLGSAHTSPRSRRKRGEPSLSRADAPRTLLTTLTPRENEILRLIGKGLPRTRIAAQLCRSPKTIDGHQDRMMRKLGIESRADLMRFAIREGLAEA